MSHADALSRCINVVDVNLTLARDTIKVEQEQDALCQQYRQQDAFLVDETVYCTGMIQLAVTCCYSHLFGPSSSKNLP